MNEIVSVVEGLGFTVACVVSCGIFIWKTQQQSREDAINREEREREETAKREERMYSQLDKFGDSMDKFNDTLIVIDTRLQRVEKEVIKDE